MASLRATVWGRVQGVFFRAFVESAAERLDLKGYVCNMPGGEVEVIAEGEKSSLERLVEYLRTGPPSAQVKEVLLDWGEYTGNYSRFSIRY
ncbi:MAG: acylphosphatase [Dehalococcoidales bacterium]|nr:acylphosphatase [Dehalococcoidales bacterium]